MTIHPKASGAAIGSSLGLILVSVLSSIHGVHLDSTLNAAIPAFLSTLLAWLVPGPASPSPAPSGLSNQSPAG